MTIFHLLYNLLGAGLFWLVFPFLWLLASRTEARRSALAQRLGYDGLNRRETVSVRPRIWIHAVSVGEVQAAEIIVHALDAMGPRPAIVLTTTTVSGQHYARQRLAHRATIRYAPLDLWSVVGRFLSAFEPDLLVCVETEIWPNWILRAHRAGIPTVIVNGRISARSIGAYEKIRPLLQPVLTTVAGFSMITETDARRIRRLGAPQRRIRVNGNVKIDAMNLSSHERREDEFRGLLCLDDETPVWVAGSVRGAESDLLLEVYRQLALRVPRLVFIIAPRHLEKAPRMARIAREKGLDWQYRTDLGPGKGTRLAPVVILDTIGELRAIYALASVVFCGGSLVPLGGQNVLEAAIQAKPVLFGPHMEDFSEEKKLLEAYGGGICVAESLALQKRTLDLLRHPGEARRLGRLAKQAVLSQRGAALRHAQCIVKWLR